MFFRTLRCSFCRRSDKDVAKLVAGASGYICDTCARQAVRIMETPPPSQTTPARSANESHERASGWNRTWHFASAVD
jgi:ATP-dependent protease Clp ATPase subunit